MLISLALQLAKKKSRNGKSYLEASIGNSGGIMKKINQTLGQPMAC